MKIAVIGSGISGLGSALLLSQKHDVHLFESQNRLGGHAHTSVVSDSKNNLIPIDTGFLVYNELTYPHLCGLFDYLKVETSESDMSLSIRVPKSNIEWAGDNLNSVFAQRKNILNLQFLWMLKDVLKLHKNAPNYLLLCQKNNWTLKEFLNHQGFKSHIQDWYIFPMLAAIWSTSEKKMMNFPATTFFTFFLNHKLLQVEDRPKWRTVKNGSINYVEAIARKLKSIHLAEPVVSAKPTGGRIEIQTQKDRYVFDKVVFATHAPITQKILKTESTQLQNWLNQFRTNENRAVLHQDISTMPKNKSCWSSWNVFGHSIEQETPASLVYYLNRLQPLITDETFLLSLNPTEKMNTTVFETIYHHPEFDQNAVAAQSVTPEMQGLDGCYFAGAWTRYGFHEDGLLSAVNVAKCFGILPQWGQK